MNVLHVLNALYRKLNNPGAIVRIDMDQDAHGDNCKVVVIAGGIYAAGVVDAADWDNPDQLIDEVIRHFESVAQ
jgi:hypothetical protein